MLKHFLSILLVGTALSISGGYSVSGALAQGTIIDDSGLSGDGDQGGTKGDADGAGDAETDPEGGIEPSDESNETTGGGGDLPESAFNDGEGDFSPDIMMTIGGGAAEGSTHTGHGKSRREVGTTNNGGHHGSGSCVLKSMGITPDC